jgi:hypothetical protein
MSNNVTPEEFEALAAEKKQIAIALNDCIRLLERLPLEYLPRSLAADVVETLRRSREALYTEDSDVDSGGTTLNLKRLKP